MKKKLISLSILILSFIGMLTAQDGADKLAERFNNYQGKVLQEKIFMHTDKDFYLAGDIMWFKLYYVDASFHQPLNLSKVAYIEITDQNNKPVLQSKTALLDGSGKGSFFLPVSMNSGNYKIRAYTNWMKNFSVSQFFEKRITIVNPQKKRELLAKEKKSPPDIQFFPEGGNMVYGINSKIACKVSDQYGKGITYQGSIVDEQNRTVASFHSLQFGMCSFDFNPSSNHRYKAVIDIKGEEKISKELPSILREGYVMRVENKSGQVIINVETNIASATEVYLFVQTRQSVKASVKGAIRNGVAMFQVDKNQLGDGISHITILNSAQQPICERLYFKYPENKLNIELIAGKTDYNTKERIDIGIRTSRQDGKPSNADLSMAVYRIDSLQSRDEMNITNYLLLTSDLKGYIESPSYYFKGEQNETMPATDNLMLTQGWRRFRWTDITTDKTPALNFKPEFNGHIVTGRLINGTTGAIIPGAEVYLSVPGSKTRFYPAISGADGKVKFEVKKIEGSSEIIVQSDPLTDSAARVEVTNPFSETYSDEKLPPFQLSNTTANTLADYNVSTQVQNIFAGDKQKGFAQDNDSVAFYGKPDGVYFMDDYTRFSTMEEVIREYVGFMDVVKKKGHYGLNVLDMSTNSYFQVDPLVLVDGVPLTSTDKLITLDPLQFRKIEVVNRRYFLGNTFFNGILNFQTFKGDLANLELDPRATVMDYEGLQLQREFYSPSYDTQDKINSHLPDFRNVLYWSPDIRVDQSGKNTVHFYTSDRKGKYIMMLQGLSKDGNPASATMMFEVK
jgi:hypothetical protein